MAIYILFRFDTEDFVTPESNDALLAIAEAFNARGIRATFPVVGEKARFLRREGRDDVIRALKPHALGFHTHWHSVHPTLTERAEALSWEEGIASLDETERPGLDAVADVFGRFPCSYTQAGGNWLPHSHALLPRWGIPIFYTETWNSYLDIVGSPYEIGGSIGLTSPVTVMRVLDLATQGREEEARRQVSAALDEARRAGGGMLGFVAHPTELVTKGTFWDALNFGGGVNRVPKEGPYLKPALKTRGEAQADLAAFTSFLDFLLEHEDVEILAVDEYLERVTAARESASHEPDVPALARWVAEGRPPASSGIAAISALDALALLGRAATGEASPPFAMGPVEEGVADEPHREDGSLPVHAPVSAWREAWRSLCAATDREGGALPARFPLGPGKEASAGALLSALGAIVDTASRRYPGVRPLDAVDRLERERNDPLIVGRSLDPSTAGLKPVERLHWDWPIFAPGARFDRCYAWTRAAMWSLRRLPDPAQAGAGRIRTERAG